MARSFGKVQVSIWDDDDFLRLGEPAQRLYLMLTSFPTISNAGVLPMTLKRWASRGPSYSPVDVHDQLEELAAAGFVGLDDDTEEVLVRTFIRNDNIPSQPQLMKNALRAARDLSSVRLRRMLARELRRLARQDADATADVLDPPPHPTPPAPSAQPGARVGAPSAQPAGSLNGLPAQPERSSSMPAQGSPIQAPRSLAAGCADPGVVGEGEGVISSPVVDHLGGARAGARTREASPPPPIPLHRNATTGTTAAPCGTHPDDDRPCHRCRDIRLAAPPPPPTARPFWS